MLGWKWPAICSRRSPGACAANRESASDAGRARLGTRLTLLRARPDSAPRACDLHALLLAAAALLLCLSCLHAAQPETLPAHALDLTPCRSSRAGCEELLRSLHPAWQRAQAQRCWHYVGMRLRRVGQVVAATYRIVGAHARASAIRCARGGTRRLDTARSRSPVPRLPQHR